MWFYIAEAVALAAAQDIVIHVSLSRIASQAFASSPQSSDLFGDTAPLPGLHNRVWVAPSPSRGVGRLLVSVQQTPAHHEENSTSAGEPFPALQRGLEGRHGSVLLYWERGEIILTSSAKSRTLPCSRSGRSLTNSRNRRGPMTDPWGTPLPALKGREKASCTRTLKERCVRICPFLHRNSMKNCMYEKVVRSISAVNSTISGRQKEIILQFREFRL